jgi:hypothetical protein
MAYSNFFPTGYQPMTQFQNPQPQPQNSMIWVQGEAGAKSYLVAPNTTIPLWDSESQTIYIKSADNSGMPSMKIIDYTIRNNPQSMPQIKMDDTYVTREELTKFKNDIQKQIEELKEANTNE